MDADQNGNAEVIWFDLDNDGTNDVALGTSIPWLPENGVFYAGQNGSSTAPLPQLTDAVAQEGARPLDRRDPQHVGHDPPGVTPNVTVCRNGHRSGRLRGRPVAWSRLGRWIRCVRVTPT